MKRYRVQTFTTLRTEKKEKGYYKDVDAFTPHPLPFYFFFHTRSKLKNKNVIRLHGALVVTAIRIVFFGGARCEQRIRVHNHHSIPAPAFARELSVKQNHQGALATWQRVKDPRCF